MKKIFDILDMLLAFTTGVLLTMVVSSMIYALGAPRIILVAAMALVGVALTAITAYTAGRRRENISCKIAYNKGVQRGREIGRAERHSAAEKFLE